MSKSEPNKSPEQVVVPLTMSLEEARKVIWPWDNTPVEMGKLFDIKQIGYGDLARAIFYGPSPQVREAARTILAHELGQPTASRYGPVVVEGSHYLEERERDSLIESSLYFGLAIGVGIWLVISFIQIIITYVIPQLIAGNLIALIIAGAFFSLVIIVLTIQLYPPIRKRLRQFKTFRAGREGEELIVDRLRTALDNHWTIFRNVHLPGRNDDIDIVLVGPGGVWAVSVKSSKATLRVEGKKWQIQTKKGWVATDNNPSDKITKSAYMLNDFLKRQGIVRYIERAIALAESQPVTNFTSSEIPVWLLPTMAVQVANLSTSKPPTEDDIRKILSALKDLATKQIAKEEAKYGK